MWTMFWLMGTINQNFDICQQGGWLEPAINRSGEAAPSLIHHWWQNFRSVAFNIQLKYRKTVHRSPPRTPAVCTYLASCWTELGPLSVSFAGIIWRVPRSVSNRISLLGCTSLGDIDHVKKYLICTSTASRYSFMALIVYTVYPVCRHMACAPTLSITGNLIQIKD